MSRCAAAWPLLLLLAACGTPRPHGTVTVLQHIPAEFRTDPIPQYGTPTCDPECHSPAMESASVTRQVTTECWQVTLLADGRTTAVCVDPGVYAGAWVGEQWPP